MHHFNLCFQLHVACVSVTLCPDLLAVISLGEDPFIQGEIISKYWSSYICEEQISKLAHILGPQMEMFFHHRQVDDHSLI
jgi:hypothetical protein